jgi:hypothetical protein
MWRGRGNPSGESRTVQCADFSQAASGGNRANDGALTRIGIEVLVNSGRNCSKASLSTGVLDRGFLRANTGGIHPVMVDVKLARAGSLFAVAQLQHRARPATS